MRRFARPSAAAKLEADPFLCRHLRSRAWVAPEGDPRALPAGSAAYWCLRTMRPEGPDGSGAAPEECTDDRICFEATVSKGRDS
jgi:hypothetical protein